MESSDIIILIAMLIRSALFSGVEIAFVTSDRVLTELEIRRGGVIGRILNRFYEKSSFFISTILVGNNIALVIYGMAAAKILEPWLMEDLQVHNEGVMLLLSTIISTLVILLCGEFLPKTLFKINPNNSLKISALPIFIIYIILYPISLFTTWLSRLLMRIAGVKDTETPLGFLSLGELNSYIERQLDKNTETPENIENEVKIFHNALDFSTIHLRDCMIPRNEIVAVDIENTTTEELSALFVKSGRSKILVYREDIDNIMGYIHVAELFHPDHPWQENIKEVLFAPETQLANKMMKRLLAEKRSIAVIIDEFGGTAGMVTLEDLVEEIFGDIQDEHDHTRLTQIRIDDNTFEFAGRMEIEYINETYHLDIPEDDDYQTLAGYILHSTGSIPAVGETITLGNLELTVQKKSATRLELIKVHRNPKDNKE